jgi:membrane protein
VQLTSADKRSYTAYAESERHKGFETVDVDFEAQQQASPPHREEPGG